VIGDTPAEPSVPGLRRRDAGGADLHRRRLLRPLRELKQLLGPRCISAVRKVPKPEMEQVS
jgi:hypothetical protein